MVQLCNCVAAINHGPVMPTVGIKLLHTVNNSLNII